MAHNGRDMPGERSALRRHRDADALDLSTDVLVIGGGPAGAWAAVAAADAGARVVLVDKGYLGTSGATAPSNTGTWFVPPGEGRRAAIEQRQPRTGGLADPRWVDRMLDTAWEKLHRLAAWGYPFPADDDGRPYLANLRGPDYMHFMRRRVLAAGVAVLDHHPALELLAAGDTVAGAAGIDRQADRAWRIRAGAVVLATGGCAFGERILGAATSTGDGYLMAAEAGAAMSGMEFSAQYAFTPKPSAMNKGLPFRWASFYREDGTPIATDGRDRHAAVAEALLAGPVFARYDGAGPELRPWLRQGQPNCFLPLDRSGIDPFTERWPVMLRCEGTVRGVGGIRLHDDDCATGVPGLYAAGDAATRERLTGAISGGGGPNSSWAIASGNWAGRAAAAFAARIGDRTADRAVTPLGQAGLRPADAPRPDVLADDVVRIVREEMLPLDRNFFRRPPTLLRSLERLDASWTDVRSHGAGEGPAALKAREAAALLATSRWAYRSALARAESRGMHRRRDLPAADPGFVCSFHASGLDEVRVVRAGRGAAAAS
jgi:succinate dehydrogenase/fumarate reductase flavoprotein subunit